MLYKLLGEVECEVSENELIKRCKDIGCSVFL